MLINFRFRHVYLWRLKLLDRRVAIVLPIYTQWRVQEGTKHWYKKNFVTKFDNIAWDLHWCDQPSTFDPLQLPNFEN